MAKLPRGIKLTNERVDGDELVYDVRIAWWRQALLVLKVLRRGYQLRVK